MDVNPYSAAAAETDPRLDRELDDGERLIWAGRPLPGRMRRGALSAALFGIPFTAFAMFWMAGASGILFGGGSGGGWGSGGGPPGVFSIIFPLFGLPFVLVGLFMLSAPLRAARSAKKMLYALTDRRCIVWKPKFGGQVEIASYRPNELGRMRRSERADGTGDLVFKRGVRLHQRGSSIDAHTEDEGFLGVPAVAELERLVRETLAVGRAG